jgi:hypothetical protein
MLFVAVAVTVTDTTVWDPSGVSQYRCCAKAKPDRKEQDFHLLLHWKALTNFLPYLAILLGYDLYSLVNSQKFVILIFSRRLSDSTDFGLTVGDARSKGMDARAKTRALPHGGTTATAGAAWLYRRSAGVWDQEEISVGTDAVGRGQQGWAVSLSGDGRSAIVGGLYDDNGTGAAWGSQLSPPEYLDAGPRVPRAQLRGRRRWVSQSKPTAECHSVVLRRERSGSFHITLSCSRIRRRCPVPHATCRARGR